MITLKFYDLKKKKSFTSNKYSLQSKRNPRTKKMVYFAKTKAPSGSESWRIISKDMYDKMKK